MRSAPLANSRIKDPRLGVLTAERITYHRNGMGESFYAVRFKQQDGRDTTELLGIVQEHCVLVLTYGDETEGGWQGDLFGPVLRQWVEAWEAAQG